MKYCLYGLMSVAILAGSCTSEPSFSEIPYIEFRGIQKFLIIDSFTQVKTDSTVINIFFQDGDGDLGITQKEFTDSPTLKGINNYEVKAFRKTKGLFSEFQYGVPLSGFFFPLRRDGKVGPIEGNLNYSINFPRNASAKNDTIRLEIRIKDRKLQASNWVQSSEVILNPQ